MQEFGDVLQRHAAGHRLERRWYGDVDERVLLNRGGLVAGIQLNLLRVQTNLREAAKVVRSREPVGTGSGARPVRLWIDDTHFGETRWLAEHGQGRCLFHFGHGLLVFPRNRRQRAPFLQVVCDQVFCGGAANEGVAGADTRVTAASGLRTREPRFAGGETDKARSGAADRG